MAVIILSIAALAVKVLGYHPRGDVLASTSYGWDEVVGIYLMSLPSSLLLGLIVALLPSMKPQLELVIVMALGIVISFFIILPGLSHPAKLVPPGNNSLAEPLAMIEAPLLALVCWYLSKRLAKPAK